MGLSAPAVPRTRHSGGDRPLERLRSCAYAPRDPCARDEWKGTASYWTLVDGDRRLPGVAWSYLQPLAGAEALANCLAFYPRDLTCTVDAAPVRPQPGVFYGGWITPELVGPFKGEPGSSGW